MGEFKVKMENQGTEPNKDRQVDMHRDFFARAENAIANRFYLEAVFLEYAAIESRLEVLLGILGMPCNKTRDVAVRARVKISDRVECLRYCYCKNEPFFKKPHIDSKFFNEKGPLMTWIKGRNTFIHGLYKNADLYNTRTNKECKELAEKGLKYAQILYNEAKRMNRLLKSHPERIENLTRKCCNSKCAATSE